MGYEHFMNFTGSDSAGRDSIVCPKAACTNRLFGIDVLRRDSRPGGVRSDWLARQRW